MGFHWYIILLHINYGYQCDKAVNKINIFREVTPYHVPGWITEEHSEPFQNSLT